MIIKIFLCLLFYSTLIGQTENQIKRAKEFVKTSGMSKKEAISIAKSKGYSDSAIEKALKNETVSEKKSTEVDKGQTKIVEMTNMKTKTEQKVVENEDSKISNADDELPIIDELEFDEIKKESNESLKNTGLDNNSLKYFGYDIFKNDPKLFQLTSVGLVNPNYLIGPGDEIIVMLWGETQFRQVLTVDREGFIFIPEVGQVFVNGLNMNLLESKLFRVLSQSYASLNKQGGKATTFLDVSLGNLRPLRIQVLGEVSQPGAYIVSPSATLFSSLYYFNGPTFLGSLRDIRLIRNNQEVTSIDFYNYLLTGKKLSDTNLQLDDVIFIPKRLKSVSIGGEINRPGIYELKSKESLKDLILMSGGLKTTAYLERAQIDRIVPFEDREKMGMERMLIDVNINDLMNDKNSFSLKDGDKVEIFSILEIRQNYVEISGAVTRPGSYDIGSGLSLSELILKSDSLLGDAYLDRVDITRIKSDFTEQLIKLNLGKVLDKETENDIRLQGLDRVRVYSMRDMIPNTSVSISGYVKFPGKYLLQENMTLYDLIFKAGGYVDQEYKKQVYLDRAELIRTFKNNEKEVIPFNLGEVLDNRGIANTKLLPNDAVRTYGIKEVEGDTRYVSISGNVKKPGKYELYQMNMTVYDLIFKAGGFKDELYRGTTYLQRADLYRFDDNRITKSIIPFHLGKVIEDSTHVDNIELKPGDEIIVYSKNIFEKVKPISITGNIIKPGSYKYKTDMNLKDLILEAGGLSKDFSKYRVDIARLNIENMNEFNFAENITFDISIDFLKDKSIGGPQHKLEPFDNVFIRPSPYSQSQKTVNIVGEVYYPGDYAILNSKEKITDIIARAGGIKENAYPYGSIFIRGNQEIQLDFERLLKKPNSKYNFEVNDKDKLIINNKPNIIRVVGEINSPGNYKFIPGQRVSRVIRNAGGINPDADINNIFIEYPNGSSKKFSRWLNNPKVRDGSVITIGKKPEEEPFNKTEYFKELTSIIANLAQALSLVIIARL